MKWIPIDSGTDGFGRRARVRWALVRHAALRRTRRAGVGVRAIAGSALMGVLAAAPARAASDRDGSPAAPAPSRAAPLPTDSVFEDGDEATAARRKHWGLMFDLGSMHGGMLSLVARPAPWLRLHAGAGTNAVSPGYRAGLTLAKPGTGPALNIEGGHFLPGDMNGLLKILVGTGYRANSRLEEFDYDFVNLHGAWEIESGSLTFFARGGASILWTRLPALPEAGADPLALGTDTEFFWLVLPSVAVGFVGFL